MTNVKQVPVSVAIVAKDEADRIAAWIDNLHFVDDVVMVVDNRSTDQTQEFAQVRGCTTIANSSGSYMKYAKLR